MNLFDVLSNDERIIVYSDVGARQVYTWNRSLTLQVWSVKSNFQESDIRTLSDQPRNYEAARKEAIKWSQD
tara:strand:- start:1210 stop:1422 length:213 start_codon:yes stop_codon:yes gene_type:complete